MSVLAICLSACSVFGGADGPTAVGLAADSQVYLLGEVVSTSAADEDSAFGTVELLVEEYGLVGEYAGVSIQENSTTVVAENTGQLAVGETYGLLVADVEGTLLLQYAHDMQSDLPIGFFDSFDSRVGRSSREVLDCLVEDHESDISRFDALREAVSESGGYEDLSPPFRECEFPSDS